MAVILVVEDEEEIRVLVKAILVDDGHQTLSAGTTAQALVVIQTDHPIDLLFTDIRLGPDVPAGLAHSGLALAHQAVELRPDLRVLYTTGYGVTDGMKAMFVPGFIMPGAQEGNPIPHGLQPGLPREDTPFKDPARRNRPGRPKGSVNRYTSGLKEMFLHR
jgi:CheY-like chemotaxis protein